MEDEDKDFAIMFLPPIFYSFGNVCYKILRQAETIFFKGLINPEASRKIWQGIYSSWLQVLPDNHENSNFATSVLIIAKR